MATVILYVGDSNDVVKRIRQNHCSGNVEGSALREAIARHLGYELSTTSRSSGSQRIRIATPADGEDKISAYISAGHWKYVTCDSLKEAQDFQWYLIEDLKPTLNSARKGWDHAAVKRYGDLSHLLQQSAPLSCAELAKRETGPGVYVFIHEELPLA